MIPTTADIGRLQVRGVTVHRCMDDPPRAREPRPKNPPKPRPPKKPRELSWGKVAEIRAWFLANPGEYLSFADMVQRFDVSLKRAYNIAIVLRAEGLVRSEVLVCLNPERDRAVGDSMKEVD